MACPYCGTHADWYKLDDGRSRCPGCYATTDENDAKAAKEQEAKDSTDKATTTPPLIADDVQGKASEAPKPASKDVKGK